MERSASLLPFEDIANGLKAADLEQFKAAVHNVLTDARLDEGQKLVSLAKLAENTQAYPGYSPRATAYVENGVICNLFEGAAPMRPRYISPDYRVVLRQGSKFLEVEAPRDLPEALMTLIIAYRYVPSITTYPVFFGDLGDLLEPFVGSVPLERAREEVLRFWRLLDRLFPDGFAHANIGPRDTLAARLILEADRRLVQTVPNLSLKYDPAITGDDLALLAVENALLLNKPYFANHPMMVADWGPDYAIASCYNLFPVGGGSHTLARLNLKRLVEENPVSPARFLDEVLPDAVERLVEVLSRRATFIVEDVGFFVHSFLAKEGWISLDKFTSMAGFVALAEAVNLLMGGRGRYGHSAEANALAGEIVRVFHDTVKRLPAAYCQGSGGHAIVHAQVGIDADTGITPGARIPPGEEPELYEHISILAAHDKYLDGGVSSIFVFEETAKDNPRAVLDVIQGAFRKGMRLFAVSPSQSELVRISGWLMKRCELMQYRAGEALRIASSNLGGAQMERLAHGHRRVNTLERAGL